MRKLLRGAFVIGRRDFSATVLSKTFLFFLIGPLFPLLMGVAFAFIGASGPARNEQPVVAVIGTPAEFARLSAARSRLADALDEQAIIQLVRFAPEPGLASQTRRLLVSEEPPVRAVLTGDLEHPHLTGSIESDGSTVRQLQLILAEVGRGHDKPIPVEVTSVAGSPTLLANERALTAKTGQFLLFFLTILLAGMVLSQLIEEKSNKIIEVVAAAVPIESLFVGKLFAMLAASVVGLVVWTGVGAIVVTSLKSGGLSALPDPAVGWPTFLALAIAYFGMNYLLFGSVFLMIGAQASTAREVQTLSMPATFGQVLIFGFAAATIGAPESPAALAAAIFPLSSPMAMFARAAETPELWPHFAALAWQAVWVSLILRLGAGLFRRTVLKSGPTRPLWKLRRA
jgi:ABC-2 type transport system permease protein